jgi:hypothetical protein
LNLRLRLPDRIDDAAMAAGGENDQTLALDDEVGADLVLEPQAIQRTRRRLVVAGCEAHVCVLQTVLGLRGQGFEISLAADAVGSRRSIDRTTALARLARNSVEIVTAEMVLFEWLERSDHPKFKELLALIR